MATLPSKEDVRLYFTNMLGEMVSEKAQLDVSNKQYESYKTYDRLNELTSNIEKVTEIIGYIDDFNG